MNSKSSSTALNLLIAIAILVVVNYIVGGLGVMNFRADLTEKNIFTLSQGTKNLLGKLNPEKPITIRLYITRDNRLMPQWAQAYAVTVQDLLLEFEKNSDGNIKLDKIDPRPNTEDEDRATADDIQGYTVNDHGDKAYFGLAIECLQKREVLPSLNPNEESNLEYKVARAIAKVSATKQHVVGLMSPMPIGGPAMQFPGMQQRQPPAWMIVQQLRLDYEVVDVPMSTNKIEDNIDLLLVAHPYGISETAQFAIDQFVLRGGKVVAFVDPQCLVARTYDNPGQPGMMPTTSTSPMSDMPKLLSAWGVKYDQGKIVADMSYRSALGGRGRPSPTFVAVDSAGLNLEEPVISALEVVQLFGAGAFTFPEKKPGITYTELIQSSENSEFVDITAAEQAQREPMKSFNSDGRKKVMAVRLSGKFTTAFPDGAPPEKAPVDPGPALPGGFPGGFPGGGFPGGTRFPSESGGEDKKDAGAPADAAKAKAKDKKGEGEKKEEKPASLKEGNGEGVVFLFADADMFYDFFALQSDGQGRVFPVAINGNIPLLMNIMEFLSGGSDLIDVRSRAVTKRPFTKMQDLQQALEAKYRPMVEQKQKEMQTIVDEITAKGGNQEAKKTGIVMINPEELRKLRDQQIAIQKEIREFQKEESRDKDRLEMLITALNILGVPLLLVAFGVTLALRRSSLRAAH